MEPNSVKTFTLEELVGQDKKVIIITQEGIEVQLEQTEDGTRISYPLGNKTKKVYGDTVIRSSDVIVKNRQMVFSKLQEIVYDLLHVEYKDITLESKYDDFGADSLDQVEIVMKIESEFDINIPDSDAEYLMRESLEKTLDYIIRK